MTFRLKITLKPAKLKRTKIVKLCRRSRMCLSLIRMENLTIWGGYHLMGIPFSPRKSKSKRISPLFCGSVFWDDILYMFFFTKRKRISHMFWGQWVLMRFSTCFLHKNQKDFTNVSFSKVKEVSMFCSQKLEGVCACFF